MVVRCIRRHPGRQGLHTRRGNPWGSPSTVSRKGSVAIVPSWLLWPAISARYTPIWNAVTWLGATASGPRSWILSAAQPKSATGCRKPRRFPARDIRDRGHASDLVVTGEPSDDE